MNVRKGKDQDSERFCQRVCVRSQLTGLRRKVPFEYVSPSLGGLEARITNSIKEFITLNLTMEEYNVGPTYIYI